MLTVRELVDKQEMINNISVLQVLYPSLTLEEYEAELDQMLPHNYGQVGVFDGEDCLGISGFWIGTKLWCGKYLELDNIIVTEKKRGQGIGKLIFDFPKNLNPYIFANKTDKVFGLVLRLASFARICIY